MWSLDAARVALGAVPSLALFDAATPVQTMDRLREQLGGGPRLLIKRDDLIGFGFGGNKVRKMALVGARARANGADTLISTGGVQSNHARVTAAVAARLGMKCVLVLNGRPPQQPTGNVRLRELLGCDTHYVESREQRSLAMAQIAEHLADRGRHPFIVPLGASTPLGALGYARAIGELLTQIEAPDVIVHSTSSGGTQAGLLAGCALFGLNTRVIGISADLAAADLARTIRELLREMAEQLGLPPDLMLAREIEIDAGFVGEGYGIPTPASDAATRTVALSEGIFLDPTYTAKAMAGLIDYVRTGRLSGAGTVLFWHTGGLPGLFA
jgi:1-aminocyclopropane-1-carboxylate deaminase/D-cysteine desulfhydrase-like pyridoxal-dependent ACC family enzyme